MTSRGFPSGAILAATAAALAGCASMFATAVNLPPASVQALEYYPRQVKGYQNSYPQRRMLILAATDAREFKDPSATDHQPDSQGDVAIGVVLDRGQQIIQRVYTPALGPVVQKAFATSAQEAGFTTFIADESLAEALKKRTNVDYVLAAKVVRCWVKKQRGIDTRYGPTWATAADFSAEVTIYKPPFRTPFWEGPGSATYDDPPLTSLGITPGDDTSIYDEPGQVLSVAMTRAVAGIFRRSDLRSLVLEDTIRPH
jgi:hypothetical protein